jgi:EAL domain-containing protein (putative c-di-GMP-specific phosphodiesterase class I)
MDIAFLVQIEGGDQIVRVMDGDPESFGISPDDRRSLDETYCGLLLRGEIAPLVPDTAADPVLRVFPATESLQVGAYIGMPVRFPDGELFGMLACASHRPVPWLGDQDLLVLRSLADVIAAELVTERQHWHEVCLELRVSRDLIEAPMLIRYQPIVHLGTGRTIGVEALARFPGSDVATDVSFRRAWAAGYGADLELRAIREALRPLEDMPPEWFLTVNVSPRLLTSTRLDELLANIDLSRVVLELTEHSRMEAPASLREQLAPLHQRGLRLAVDDAGAGYSGLNRIIDLAPDFIKLDAALARGINHDLARKALARSLVAFAGQIGARLVVEGIETAEERDELRGLGVELGQGFILGRPEPFDAPSGAGDAESCAA